jgi:hypothetical protein
MRRGKRIGGFGMLCGELGLREREAARVAWVLGTPATGLQPRTTREKDFPSNLLLHLIDTSPLFK